ncbi:AraC family transcriptional regulator [Caballeronia humi]|uniref:AraC family transcriptional regulator n=1 Tax=Caballeronia humi TaxID=326474 RepID=A0A158J4T1_9BURK|nr:AraC family transcriptional regulator [Caballeronia humi]
MPRGQAHLIGSSREAVQESAGNLPICPGLAPGEPVKLGHSGRTAQTRLICGFFACHDTLMNPVLLGLPCIFKADLRNDPHSPWFEWTLGLAAAEAAEWSAGSAVMLARLSELLFVAAVRGFIDALPTDRKGWLAGVGDRFVGLALAILHGKPAHGWTIEQLAQKTGLSPAALVQRFTHLLGEPPLQYLARLRVEIAAQKLANDTVAVGRDDAGRL